MLIEAIYHLVNLEFDWFIQLVLLNLHLLFVFVGIIFFFANGKKVFSGTVALVLMLWVLNDVGSIFRWATFVGGFLSIHYIIKIGVLAFAEDDPRMSKKLIWVNEISSYIVWIAYNFFVVGF